MKKLNTSEDTSMNGMFFDCPKLTELDLSGFDTGKVTSMRGMFERCPNLKALDISGFNTENVTDMSYMFDNCSNLASLDLSNFDTSNVTNMSDMFGGCSSLTDLNVKGFDTSNVTDMQFMFSRCSSLKKLDVSNFDTSRVENMISMFGGCSSLTDLDVSSFNTENVTDMSDMFEDCSKLTALDLSNFDTSKVGTYMTSLDDKGTLGYFGGMTSIFDGCSNLEKLDVSKFNTANVTNMYCMFYDCSSLTTLDLSNFDTSNVINMGGMFDRCSSLTSLDVSHFDTSNVIDMYRMLATCRNLTDLNLSSFNTEKVTDMNDMMTDCSSLNVMKFGSNFVIPSGSDPKIPTPTTTASAKKSNGEWALDTENADTSYSPADLTSRGVTEGTLNGTWYAQAVNRTAYAVFDNKAKALYFIQSDAARQNGENRAVTSISGDTYTGIIYKDFENGISSDVKSANSKWLANALDVHTVKFVDAVKPSNTADWFNGMSNCTDLDLTKLDTSNVTDMNHMFYGCALLTDLDLSSFDTSKVEDMSSMFDSCVRLESLNIGSFDLSSITDSAKMLGFDFVDRLKKITTPKKISSAADVYLPNITSSDFWLESKDPIDESVKYDAMPDSSKTLVLTALFDFDVCPLNADKKEVADMSYSLINTATGKTVGTYTGRQKVYILRGTVYKIVPAKVPSGYYMPETITVKTGSTQYELLGMDDYSKSNISTKDPAAGTADVLPHRRISTSSVGYHNYVTIDLVRKPVLPSTGGSGTLAITLISTIGLAAFTLLLNRTNHADSDKA